MPSGWVTVLNKRCEKAGRRLRRRLGARKIGRAGPGDTGPAWSTRRRRSSSRPIKNLKAALPLINGNEGMLGVALFNLGWPIISLARAAMKPRRKWLQAATYSEQAAKTRGGRSGRRGKNAPGLLKTDSGKMR